MASFYAKFDSLIKDFCKEIASTYSLNEGDLFSIWKGEKPVKKQTLLKPEIKIESKAESKSDSKESSTIEKSSQPEDPDTEITKEKIMVANKDMLSAMCKKKGLKMSGKKEDLVQRLMEHLASSSKPSKSSSSSSTSSSSSSVTSSSSSSSTVSKTLPKKTEESSVIKNVKASVSDIAIRKNKYGNFEHMQTGLVFNTDKMVYGKQNEDGSVTPLKPEDIELCKKYKFNYKLPENLNVSKNLDDIKIDDVEEEEDLDDEDLEEDLEEEEEEPLDDEDK